jgi:arylamine N-acetyltransferase
MVALLNQRISVTHRLIVILRMLEEIPVVTTPEIFDWYFSILGIEQEEPSFEHLSRLVRAQLIRVPFENISKLYLKKTQNASYIPSLEEHLTGIEDFNFGGTCYANNPYFAALLRHSGYDVDLCGADMTRPDVHVVSLVRLEGREYLVDVGYGAPFYSQMPRDLDRKHEVAFGNNLFVLHPRDAEGQSRMDHLRDGTLIHGYTAKPQPRGIEHFDKVIRNSYSDAATFMNVVVIERFFSDHAVRIHNLTLTESTATGASVTHLADKKDLVEAIGHHCGFPADIIQEAVADIALEADIYS